MHAHTHTHTRSTSTHVYLTTNMKDTDQNRNENTANKPPPFHPKAHIHTLLNYSRVDTSVFSAVALNTTAAQAGRSHQSITPHTQSPHLPSPCHHPPWWRPACPCSAAGCWPGLPPAALAPAAADSPQWGTSHKSRLSTTTQNSLLCLQSFLSRNPISWRLTLSQTPRLKTCHRAIIGTSTCQRQKNTIIIVFIQS